MKRRDTHTKKTRLLAIIILSLLITIPTHPLLKCSTTKTIIYVDDDGGADYDSIQEAIDAAESQDTIFVYNGTYYENIVVTKTITLLGEDKKTTIIDGYNDEFNLIIHISADNVNINGFTIQNSKQNYYSSGIIINNSHFNSISNNTITCCKDGIVLWDSSENNTIYHNNFINNTNHVNITSGTNLWNQSYPSGGNYWDDFASTDLFSGSNQNISGSDGIYDTSYNISNGIDRDNYTYVHPDGWLNNPPTAEAKGPYIIYIDQTITFDGSDSNDIDGEIIYLWDFGDGTKESGEFTNHTYTCAGTYTVTLVVTDELGATDSDATFAHIWDSTEGEWIFNATNDSYVNQKTPSVNYSSESYLEVSNNYGNNSSDWQHYLLIKFNLSAIPSVTNITQSQLYLYYYDYDENDTVDRNLSIRRITDSWNESTVTWDNRPTNSSENTSNSIIPSSFGWMTWDVLSDVQDYVKGTNENYGWQIMDLKYWGGFDIPTTKFKSKETQTNYTPYLKITYDTPLVPHASGPYQRNISEEIQFYGSFIGSGIPPYVWTWDFGDGTTSDEQNATHAYSKTGDYTVRLTIKDENGKGDTSSTIAIIKDEKSSCPIVEITNPIKGLYINNKKMLSLRKTIIIGDIDIEVTVAYEDALIEKIEFYINDQLKYTDTKEPYIWTWDKKALFRSIHNIKLIAYDTAGNSVSDEVIVCRLL